MDTVVSPAGHAAALWSGLLILVYLVLSVLVVRARSRHQVVFGAGDVPEMERSIRVFGNAAEYIPAGIAVLTILAVVGARPLVIHGVGGALLLGRLAHAFGLSRSVDYTNSRTAGVILTWLAFLMGGALLLFYSIP